MKYDYDAFRWIVDKNRQNCRQGGYFRYAFGYPKNQGGYFRYAPYFSLISRGFTCGKLWQRGNRFFKGGGYFRYAKWVL